MKLRPACLLPLLMLCTIASFAQKGKWVTLFNGKSTDKLRGYMMDSFPSQAWKVEDGALVAQTNVPNVDFLTKDTSAIQRVIKPLCCAAFQHSVEKYFSG